MQRQPPEARRPSPDFGRATADHANTFVAIMRMLHSEPTAAAFARLLTKRMQPDDYMQLAHLFEEISVLAQHHLIPEALLFDAFAFDLYWDKLREDVLGLRASTGNEKFCENFELAAERAREYRADRPPKLKWKHPDEGSGPPGLGARPTGPMPRDAPSDPLPEPVSEDV